MRGMGARLQGFKVGFGGLQSFHAPMQHAHVVSNARNACEKVLPLFRALCVLLNLHAGAMIPGRPRGSL